MLVYRHTLLGSLAGLFTLCLVSGCPEYKLVEDDAASSGGADDDSAAPEQDTAPPEAEEDTGDGKPVKKVEECDGVDNDQDGEIDEGFPDTDADGTADCIDTEDCDGLDNDGDGETDEGFADTDKDGTLDCEDAEECDGLDNDGDGAIDEDFDEDEDGIADCDELEYEVVWALSVDDVWEGWADGVYVGTGSSFNVVDSYTMTLDSGPHVLAVYGWDIGLSIAGYIAQVTVDGTAVSQTGDGSWRSVDSEPAKGWDLPGFDDSSWDTAVECVDTSIWGSEPAALLATGARWVWYDPGGDCVSALGEGWFRYELNLP